MKTIWQDLRFAVRMLGKRPGFTVAAIIALALGIGANTAIFSVVNSVLLRPLGYKEPERLVTISHSYPKLDLVAPVSAPGYVDYRNQTSVFEETAASSNANYNLTDGSDPERVQGRIVTANFFPLLGIAPTLGRTFLAEEDKPGASRVVVLSYGLWQRRFGGDPQIVNRTIRLNNESYTVVGVMPAEFRFGRDELWTPIAFTPEQLANDRRGNEYLGAMARLKPGVTIEQAQTEIDFIARRIAEANPDAYPADSGWGVKLKSLNEEIVGDVRPALFVLLGAVGFLLLIACSNVANLMLARAAARGREIAIRTALGASRLRLVRQLLTESLLLAFVGGVAGLLLAVWGVELLVALEPADVPRAREIGIDARVLLFTIGLSLLTGILFGLLPALQASKPGLTGTLKEGGRGSAVGGGIRSARSLLVITQIAVALVLLVGAGLMVRSFSRLLDVNPGFRTENVLTMQVALPATKYREPQQRRAFFQELVERIKALPGTESVGAVSHLPLGGGVTSFTFGIEGRPAPPGVMNPHTDGRVATPDYLPTMQIPLLRGRHFTERDNADARQVAIIDETLARVYFPGEDPVGKRVTFEGTDENPIWREIVGVVGAIRHRGLDAELKAQLYYPHAQSTAAGLSVVVRAANDPASLTSAVRGAVRAVDKDQPVYGVRTMDEVLNNSVAQKRFSMFLLAIFASVALVLAAVGIYGVMAYTVSARTNEMGIRIALGARSIDILRLVVGQGMILALAGVGVGLVAALVVTRVMSSLLYGISATDPLTFAAIALLLTGVALLACYVPARRATKVDPMVALRYE
ncbi:MAG: ABC transporter permease [Pyrinomonadaceae bacterium]